jgi:cell division septal protein FtsQ
MIYFKLVSFSNIENDLISEIRLDPIQAKVYLLVTCYGKMTPKLIAEKLKIPVDETRKASKDLMTFGAFIDISETEFEAMHPRFTAVNMYRKMCERENIEFKRNKVVDSIGVILEKPYDDARTK